MARRVTCSFEDRKFRNLDNLEQFAEKQQQKLKYPTYVVDQGSLVNVVDTERHLRLVVDEDNGRVLRGEELLVLVGNHGERDESNYWKRNCFV